MEQNIQYVDTPTMNLSTKIVIETYGVTGVAPGSTVVADGMV